METSCRNLVKEYWDLQGEQNSSIEMSGSGNDLLNINDLPDSIFLHIIGHLPFQSLGTVAQVCHTWRQLSRDDLLWKNVFLRHYKLPQSMTLAPRAKSWRAEFKRLYYYTPCILREERREHRDEVLHVSFSHDGTMFATCSKDGFFKVWKSTNPSRLLFERDMMNLFSWKYTQFSQFNETDTCILVSGVYFGSQSISGEIAVFDLQGDYRMQCRVNNKPYDVFGAWYDNDHLLSGTLYWTGNFTSVSAVWLSKASQEVESEMESVSMVLYRFENMNSSSIRLLHVAEVETELGGEDITDVPRSRGVNTEDVHALYKYRSRQRHPHFELPREMSMLFRRNIKEGDFDISDEDESEEDISDDEFIGLEDSWRRKHEIQNRLDYEFRSFDHDFFSANRNVVYRCHLLDEIPEEDLPALAAATSDLNSERGPEEFHRDSSSGPDSNDEMPSCERENASGAHGGESSMSALEETCHYSERESDSGFNSELPLPSMGGNDNESRQRAQGGEDSFLMEEASSDTENSLAYGRNPSCSHFQSSPSKKEGMCQAGEEEKQSQSPAFVDCATQTEQRIDISPSSSALSLPPLNQSSSLNDLCKKPKEKLLIYTWGSETYIPHKIGIKRMKTSDFFKGARQATILLPDVMENLNNVSGDRRDVPDVSIDMHGHIVGLSLSPDQRYLYVNCRSWPKNCVIADPQESLPLAREVEIFTIDLTTFQFTGPVLRSHMAYTDSDKCFFLNLDVSEDYVVSGAEDRRGYIWDRHYGIPLYHFDHRNVVNSVALNPEDPQMAVSVSDDHTFKVWISRKKFKKYQKMDARMGRRPGRQSPV